MSQEEIYSNILNQLDEKKLVERFFRYVNIPSQSDPNNPIVPSSEGQWDLAKLLQKELKDLGFKNISLSENCVLIGHLPSNSQKDLPAIGFVAHLDTVDVNLSPIIKPQIINYVGGDICLNKEKNIYIKEIEHPEIKKYINQDIIVSDGTSVLGSDDKSAIASIMTAMDFITNIKNIEHGPLYVAFVPDEEIGLRGAKHMDFTKFPVDFAYTLDCCELGEVVYETFNAGSANIEIEGVSAHPMSAKGVMINPTLIAVDFANYFNRLETPENTDGTDGYIWVQEIHSNQSTANVILNIRDHNKNGYETKKEFIRDAVNFLQKRYPKAKIKANIEDVYGNIKDALTPENKNCINYIYKAMEKLNIQPNTIAMRGGTDGSYISTKGIPTPNFFTGGVNFHSNCEFLPIPSFKKSCAMILTLLQVIADEN